MSATVAAIAKKVAVHLATKKGTWTVIGSIIAGFLCLALLPAVVLLSISGGLSQTGTQQNDFGNMFLQQLTTSQQEQFSQMELAGQAIVNELTKLGLKEEIMKAQVIYLTYFNEIEQPETFFKDFTDCFLLAKSDEELISLLNRNYNLQINFDEYMRSISLIKHITIDENMFVNVKIKSNIDLTKWVVNAHETGWGYVPYTFGEVLTNEKYKLLKENYPEEITEDCERWFSYRTTDNFNLLKSYLLYDFDGRVIATDNSAVLDMTLQELYASATKKGSIESLPQTVGTAVINGDIIGIYIGNDEVIYVKPVNEGVVKEKVSDGEWTDWFEIPNIQYGNEGSFNNEIDFADYYNPNLKNNLDLVKWAENACETQWGYVYGTYGTVLDEKLLGMKI